MTNVTPAGEGAPVDPSRFNTEIESVQEFEVTIPEFGGSSVSKEDVAANIEKLSNNALPDHLQKVVDGNRDGELNTIKLAANIANLNIESVDSVAISLINRIRGG